MSGQSPASPPPQVDDGAVGGGAKRKQRRGRRARRGPPEEEDHAADALQQPRIPLPEVLPGEPLHPADDSCRLFESRLRALPPFTPLTPWSLFNRKFLVNEVQNQEPNKDVEALMSRTLRVEAHRATFMLASHYGKDLDRAVKELFLFRERNANNGGAALQAGGAAQRRHGTTRIFGCYACEVCLPSRSSLDRHFSMHGKDTLSLAVCWACAFPAPSPNFLEWHVFLSHPEVTSSLITRRWPNLRPNVHNDCSFCSPRSNDTLEATWSTYPSPPLDDFMDSYYIPGMELSPLKDRVLMPPPPGFSNTGYGPLRCPGPCQACPSV